MAATVKHAKVSAIPDAGDATLVEPSDWNANHVLTGVQGTITLTTTGTSGPATLIADTLNIPQYADGAGTVTTVSVVSANGLAGSVANPTTTPALTLSTTVTGVLKGNGTAISAAVANTDYQSAISLTTTGTSGAATFNGTTLNIPTYASASTAVTAVSVASANGFAGSSSGGTTPALTLSTSITGILKGNATAISAATVGTDYSVGTSALATGILKSTTATGALSIAAAGTDYEVPLTFSTGLTRTVNTVTVNTSQSIAKLSNLTTNGLVTTSASDGTLSVTVPGTGILTALGVNVGSAGAPVLFDGAGGTPSSLTATNLSGTAASLTAGNVTTNANLTGPITSSGNATAIASQTGTGTKFVVDTSPALTGTPTAPTAGAGTNTTQIATTAFVLANGGGTAATQTDQETATSTTVFVNPGVQQFHPSAAKFWASVTGNGTTLNASYNLTSKTDTGTGNLLLTIATDFSSANWTAVIGAGENAIPADATNAPRILFQRGIAAGTYTIGCHDLTTTPSAADPTNNYNVAGYGDQ